MPPRPVMLSTRVRPKTVTPLTVVGGPQSFGGPAPPPRDGEGRGRLADALTGVDIESASVSR